MRLTYSSISNLLLLPKSFHIENHDQLVNSILDSHHVFNKFYKLEVSIQPVLNAIEENGLIISNEWFRDGLKDKRIQLANVTAEINQYINSTHDFVDISRLNNFWKQKQLPIANNFEGLSNYKNLHPTYKLLLKYKNLCNYLNQWSEKLNDKGSWVDNGLLIKGEWKSFSSFTGRITARNLPLTSLPTELRDYMVAPKGFRIVSLDLNNAELRFLANYASCDSLIQKFNAGVDVHNETAQLIQKSINSDGVDDGQARNLAKRYIYSFLYGAGVQTITKNLQKVFKGVTNADVATLNKAFNQQYPEIKSFLVERENCGSLLTPFGKVKPIAKFHRTQRRNFTLQSSVSVAIKMLMTILAKYRIEIVHVLHDEVWILVPKETNIDNLIDEPLKEFEEKIKNTFLGFPTNGMLTKEIIGGKQK